MLLGGFGVRRSPYRRAAAAVGGAEALRAAVAGHQPDVTVVAVREVHGFRTGR